MYRPGSWIWGGYHPEGIYRHGYSATSLRLGDVLLDMRKMKKDVIGGEISIDKFERAWRSAVRLRTSLLYED